jgi:hypothetical protein
MARGRDGSRRGDTVSATAPPQSERAFERAVVEYAKLLGWRVFHPFDARRSEPGFPDLAMARKGRLVLAELKTDRGRVSGEQRAWLDALGYGEEDQRWAAATLAGRMPRLMVCLWRPSDWNEIQGVLQ